MLNHDPSALNKETERQLGILGVPGLAVGIMKNGGLVGTSTAGMANIEDGISVATDTVFAWASVSKTVTGTAAMILCDDGILDLDADLNTFLPFEVRNPGYPSQPILVRQLLTHTSSILDNDDVYGASYTLGDSPISLEAFLGSYLVRDGAHYNSAANFSGQCPGTAFAYSNVAAGLLGFVVERVSGVPFDRFCRNRIFGPLGMTETSFRLADLDKSRVAMPYDRDQDGNFTAHGHIGFPTYPDGLLRSSVPQMASFLAMMVGLGRYRDVRILSRSAAMEMRRPQIPGLDDSQGLIWHFASNTRLGHAGDDPGTSTRMFFDTKSGDGVLMAANGSWHGPSATALIVALFDMA